MDSPPDSARPGPSRTRSRPFRPLTPAQLDVLDLLCLGLTNAEIGARLGKSPGTVKNQVSEVLRRLQARTRAEAAVMHVRAQGRGGEERSRLDI